MFDSLYTANGPRVAPRDHERAWETVLRTPFRIVFYPVRLVGIGLEAAASYAGPRYFSPKAKPPPKAGPTVAPLVGIGAVNDVSLGVAATWIDSPVASSNLTLAGSWSTFDGRNVRFSGCSATSDRCFRLGADYDYKPNRVYYGIGNNTQAANRSLFPALSHRCGGRHPVRRLAPTPGSTRGRLLEHEPGQRLRVAAAPGVFDLPVCPTRLKRHRSFGTASLPTSPGWTTVANPHTASMDVSTCAAR